MIEYIQRLQKDLEKIATASTESILFVCPDCQRVTVDVADVVALEADNKRLRDEIERLTNAGLNCSYDAMSKGMELEDYLRVCEQKDERITLLSDEVARLEAQLSTKLTNIVDGNRDLIEALRAVKVER